MRKVLIRLITFQPEQGIGKLEWYLLGALFWFILLRLIYEII
jgi:hypothetical protein